MEKDQAYRIKKCSSCKATFSCGANSSDGRCWCADFPLLLQTNEMSDCLCPDCLKKAIILLTKEYVETITPDLAIHNKAKDLPKSREIEEIDFYVENGNRVFTAWYLLKRGNCCGNGCRHCPYGAKYV